MRSTHEPDPAEATMTQAWCW